MLHDLVQRFRQWHFYTSLERFSQEGKFRSPALPTWRVHGQTDEVAFYNQKDAVAFSLRHGLAEPVQGKSFELIEPDTMRWLIEQRTKGMDTGTVYGRIMHAHPDNRDDMVAWFKREPSTMAAFWLLRLGLATNHAPAAQAVAQWVKDHPLQWFSPATLVNKTNLPMDHSSENEDICLLGRLMASPTLMQWFFDQQIGMKHQTQDPSIWQPLVQCMHAYSTRPEMWRWPAVAHQVFKHEQTPLEFAYPQHKDVNQWAQSFSHSPAAVAYYAFSSRNHIRTWDFARSFMHQHPDVLAFHERLCLQENPEHACMPDPPVFNEDTVQALMLGVHFELSPKEFYHHAQKVLEHKEFQMEQEQKAQAIYADLDASIF